MKKYQVPGTSLYYYVGHMHVYKYLSTKVL